MLEYSIGVQETNNLLSSEWALTITWSKSEPIRFKSISFIRDTVVSVQQDTDKLDITLIVFFIQPGEEESDGEEEG